MNLSSLLKMKTRLGFYAISLKNDKNDKLRGCEERVLDQWFHIQIQ